MILKALTIVEAPNSALDSKMILKLIKALWILQCVSKSTISIVELKMLEKLFKNRFVTKGKGKIVVAIKEEKKIIKARERLLNLLQSN